MNLAQIEISLTQFLGSRWFTYLARFFMVVGIPAIGLMIWLGGGDARTRVAGVEAAVSQMSSTQNARITDSEAFQTEVRGKIGDVQDDLFAVKVDVGVIKRLVTELRQQEIAAAGPLPWPGPPPARPAVAD